jgi:hypothetical protein
MNFKDREEFTKSGSQREKINGAVMLKNRSKILVKFFWGR